MRVCCFYAKLENNYTCIAVSVRQIIRDAGRRGAPYPKDLKALSKNTLKQDIHISIQLQRRYLCPGKSYAVLSAKAHSCMSEYLKTMNRALCMPVVCPKQAAGRHICLYLPFQSSTGHRKAEILQILQQIDVYYIPQKLNAAAVIGRRRLKSLGQTCALCKDIFADLGQSFRQSDLS